MKIMFLQENAIDKNKLNIIDHIILVFAGFGIAYVIGKVMNKVKKPDTRKH